MIRMPPCGIAQFTPGVANHASLWLRCANERCQMACHVECALCEETAGVFRCRSGDVDASSSVPSLDAEYLCPSCGSAASLLGPLRVLLGEAVEAKELAVLTRR
eukprot:jgi/Mesen1/7436/ME000388S06653